MRIYKCETDLSAGVRDLKMEAVAICLDGCLESDLDWRLQLRRAEEMAQLGLRLFWEIDFGLFSRLRYPLSNEMQFRAFCLSLSHFAETVWRRFECQSVGLALFNGPLPVDIERRDEMASYLNLLAGQLPEEIVPFALFDSLKAKDRVQLAHLLSDEAFMSTKVIPYCRDEDHYCYEERMDPIAICLPNFEKWSEGIEAEICRIVKIFEKRGVPVHFISEFSLTSAWDGLDQLVVVSSGVTEAGKRKLHGFCAAGGEVLVSGSPVGVSSEIPFEIWTVP